MKFAMSSLPPSRRSEPGPGRCPLVLLALFWALAVIVPPASAAEAVAVAAEPTGSANWRWNVNLLRQLGFAIDQGTVDLAAGSQWRSVAQATEGTLTARLEFGHFPVATAGRIEFRRVVGLRRLGAVGKSVAWTRRLEQVSLLPDPTDGDRLQLVDRSGHLWFVLAHGQRRQDGGRLHYETMDVRVSAELAAALGDKRLADIAVAALDLDLPVQGFDLRKAIAADCQSPDWPGTPGTVTNVALTAITGVQAQCSAPCTSCPAFCDGVGGNSLARVKITPSAALSNVGTSYVPWNKRFSNPGDAGTTAVDFQHPYPQKDVHPFLAWSIYRINELGQLEQVGRSGGKHAFASENGDCICANDNHILGPGCSDEYSAGTNDFSFNLAPRSEVLAHTAQWGRCHSFYDPDCDGVDNFTVQDDFAQRAAAPESDLVAHPIPASRYHVEAWYLVRDDSNFDDSVGSVEVQPQWTGAMWVSPMSGGFLSGPVIDRWVPRNSMNAMSAHQVASTAQGSVHLAVKVTSIGGGKYRYDYALLNRDFGIPITAGVEPNMDLLSYHGVAALRLPVAASSVIEGFQFFDGDGNAGDDWSLSRSGGTLSVTAPGGSSLDWGSLYRISFVADSAPVTGQAAMTLATTGVLSDPSVQTLVPEASNTRIFGDGFE